MASILQYPFQFGLDGRAAIVDQDSDAAGQQQIAVLALTRVGERRLRPGFGLTDPTFAGFSPSELAAKVQLYGPDVTLGDVRVTPLSSDTQRVEIDFERSVA